MAPCIYSSEMLSHATTIVQRAASLALCLLALTGTLLILLMSLSSHGLVPVPIDLLTNGVTLFFMVIGSLAQLYAMGQLLSTWRDWQLSSQRANLLWNNIAATFLGGTITILLVSSPGLALVPLLFMGTLDLVLITAVSLGHVLHAVVYTRLEDSEDETSNGHDGE